MTAETRKNTQTSRSSQIAGHACVSVFSKELEAKVSRMDLGYITERTLAISDGLVDPKRGSMVATLQVKGDQWEPSFPDETWDHGKFKMVRAHSISAWICPSETQKCVGKYVLNHDSGHPRGSPF